MEEQGWRREARQILASLWLSIASMEMLRRLWEDRRRSFEDTAQEDELEALFAVDQKEDVAVIESLRLDYMESAVEQVASRLDSRANVTATLGGALAGAAAGLGAGFLGG